jgi:hypothetical protein
MISIKPGRPMTRAQKRASYRKAGWVCQASQCPAFRVAGKVLLDMAAELASPRR